MVVKFPVDENRPFYGKFWPKGMPHQLDYDYSLTIADLLDNAASKWAKDKVMWFLDSWMTYGQLKDYVDRFATALTNMGVTKGDVVAIHLPNCFQYVIAYYAIARIGAVSTGVNPTYKPMEILHQLKMTEARYIVVLDALFFHFVLPITDQWDFKKVIYTNLVDMATGLSPIKKILGKAIGKIPSVNLVKPKFKKTVSKVDAEATRAKLDKIPKISFMECLKSAPNPPKVTINAETDTATLIMTGGTTGVPKAAQLSHMNVVSNAMQCKDLLLNQRIEGDNQILGYKTGMVGVLPLYHSFAMTTVMNASIPIGAWMMLFPKPPPTEELLEKICEFPNENGFIYCAAEILFQRIAELPEEILAKFPIAGRIKLCVSGAGPLHDYVREPYERKTKAAIAEGYGLSEASPVVSANALFATDRELGFIGVPVNSTDWMIFDGEDFSKGPIPIGPDNVGEICVSGPQVMMGYWKNPAQTADHIKDYKGKKWLLTGDLGYMDEFGRVKIKDRKKQLIKMSGHSVFPAETESLVGQNPHVLEVAVAGLPDKKLGESVKAWVALRPESVGKITEQELLDWCKANMTQWKAPMAIEFVKELPKSNVGKVLRRVLQEADPIWIAAHPDKK